MLNFNRVKTITYRCNILNSTNQGIETASPVLLVDGYNVCGYWAKLKKHFMSGRLDIARQKLVDELVNFSMLRGLCFALFLSVVVELSLWHVCNVF